MGKHEGIKNSEIWCKKKDNSMAPHLPQTEYVAFPHETNTFIPTNP